MAATTRPEPIRARVEPGLPLGFQRVLAPGLLYPVQEHGNAERRCLPSPFGTYTRLTGRARQGWDEPWACIASFALAREVSATCPSTPAVLRPALRCVTRRTLTSVFDQLRSISFCKFRTVFQSLPASP